MRDLWRRLWPRLIPYRKRILAGIATPAVWRVPARPVPQVIERAVASIVAPGADKAAGATEPA